MKLYKRLLALGLSVVMLAGLTACGGSDSNNDGNDSQVENTNTNTNTNTNPSSETRTIRIGTWYDHYYDSTNSDIWDDPSVSDEDFAQAHFDVVAELEEKYNIRIEWVNLTFDGITESVNTSVLAGKPDCDIYEVEMSVGINMAMNGFIQNLAEILPADDDLLTTQLHLKAKNIGLTDGSVYLFSPVSAEAALYDTYPLAFNKDLLDAANLEDPRDLYERGEWTWDKWREYMLVLTQDTNADGVPDTYGFGSRHDFLFQNLLMSNGATIASSGTEGLSSPEVGEVLEFVYNMYNVDHVGNPWNADDFNYNMNAYLDGNVAFWVDAAWISSQNNDIGCDFEICWVPWPIGPSGNQDTNARRLANNGNAYMIPTGVEDPLLVYQIFSDYWNWYHGDYAYRDGNLTWWEDCAMTEENYAVMEYLGQSDGFDLWNSIDVDWDWSAILTGEMTAAQFQETWKQPVQSQLDIFFN